MLLATPTSYLFFFLCCFIFPLRLPLSKPFPVLILTHFLTYPLALLFCKNIDFLCDRCWVISIWLLPPSIHFQLSYIILIIPKILLILGKCLVRISLWIPTTVIGFSKLSSRIVAGHAGLPSFDSCQRQDIFSSSHRRDQPWGPLLSNGYQGFFPQG
jgi:hypothetical protein